MNIFLSYGADILVILASLGAMSYCMILSRRLSRLTSFDKGLGGAIAVMSAQVDEMKAALREAKAGSEGAGGQLNELVHQAREISSELEMMIAACHDFAEEAITVQSSAERGLAANAFSPGPDQTSFLETEAVAASDTESATQMFGARRTATELSEEVSASIEPLFGRRNSAAG